MSQIMAVLLNGIAQIEFDRNKFIPPQQSLYLEKMDEQMAQGIDVGEQVVMDPDLGQKAQFVAANLAHAIQTNHEANAAAMTTYLAVRMPDLKQVKITLQGEEVGIDLVFDEDYVKQSPITFNLKKD